jgi:hypothetical protein
MVPDFRPDPDGFAAMVRERVRKDPRGTERCIRILEGHFRASLDHFDIEAEAAEILGRQAEKSRLAWEVLGASGRVDPDSGEYAGTEEEALAILGDAGVFDGFEEDFRAFLMLEYIRLARQRRN